MTFIWLPVQNISVDLVELQNKYMWGLLQTHPFSGSGAQHWLWEWRTPISCYRNYFKSPVTYFFFFFLFFEPHFCRRLSLNTSLSILKAEEVRFMDIHFAWRVFHLKLLQIMPSSDLTSVPQGWDHCLKLSVTVFFLPPLLLALFSFLLSHILLNNRKFYGD